MLLYRRAAEPDNRVLRFLEDHLVSEAHDVFIDRHMSIGVEWAQEIETQIRQADVVVALLSANSIHSEMVEHELAIAHDASQAGDGTPRIVPVRLAYDGDLPPAMGNVVNGLPQLRWSNAEDDGKLCVEVGAAVRAPVSSLTESELLSAPVGGAVPLDSKLYVSRDTDDLFHRSVTRRDSIILIKGARQMGKTSLLARGLMQAREEGVPAPFTDLQALSLRQVGSAEAFFLSLAYSLVEQLDLDAMPEDTWTDRLGPGVNFERYIRRVALKEVDQLVWALDEVDGMFETDYASEVFGLFRSWHNKRALDPTGPWSKLTLVIAYATEAHLFIKDVNQSPFNVGTRLELGDFDESQIAELNARYGGPLSAEEVARFTRLVGGHPYLAQRGFQAVVEHGLDFATLEATAAEEDGPYGDHLRRILVLLAQNEERRRAVSDLLAGQSNPDAETFYHLRTAGLLIGGSMQSARFRNDLYPAYLRRHLL